MESHHRETTLGELYESTLNLLIVASSTTRQKKRKLIRSFEAFKERKVTEYFLCCTPESPVHQLISICSDYFRYWWSLGAVHKYVRRAASEPSSLPTSPCLRAVPILPSHRSHRRCHHPRHKHLRFRPYQNPPAQNLAVWGSCPVIWGKNNNHESIPMCLPFQTRENKTRLRKPRI